MKNKALNRRQLLRAAVMGGATLTAASHRHAAAGSGRADVPAALGGQPVRTAPLPNWPRFRDTDERAVLPVLRSGVWSRASVVDEAERRFAKCRMAEYQASILITQMESFEAECKQRSENAAYLTQQLQQIPGIIPRTDYSDVTRTAFYYYGFRYRREQFDGLPRAKFIAALAAEGIEASEGLGVINSKPMNKEGCIDDAFRSKA